VNAGRQINAMREMAASERGRSASRALQVARTDLAELLQRYGAEHPDVERARRTVTRLEKETAASGRSGSGGDRSDGR